MQKSLVFTTNLVVETNTLFRKNSMILDSLNFHFRRYQELRTFPYTLFSY